MAKRMMGKWSANPIGSLVKRSVAIAAIVGSETTDSSTKRVGHRVEAFLRPHAGILLRAETLAKTRRPKEETRFM